MSTNGVDTAPTSLPDFEKTEVSVFAAVKVDRRRERCRRDG
jgi:hypothetical protein